MQIRIIIWVIIALFFTSCDPSRDETIVVKNNTQLPIIIVVEKRGDYTDTTKYNYFYEYDNPRIFKGDSLLVVNCNIEAGGVLKLLDYGPLGVVNIKTKEIGMSYLKEISDSIYVVGHTMNKSFYELENWDLSVDINRYGGGFSQYSFTIENEDLE